MSPLQELHRRLAKLRRRRWMLRAGGALCALLLFVLWTLTLLFIFDWGLRLGSSARAVILIFSSLGWAAIAFVLIRPWFARRESETELALFVERQQHIDSDLVAALEFERLGAVPSARRGSPLLQQAVLNRVGEMGRQVDVFRGVNYRPLIRRAGILGGSLLALGVLAVIFAPYTATFFDRLLLAETPYPTRTRITRLVINGQEYPPSARELVVRCSEGDPVELLVECAGVIPARGRVELWELDGNARGEEALQQDPEGISDTVSLRATLPRLLRNVGFQLHLGDAWTHPGQLQVVSLPRVQVSLHTIPPDYLQGVIPPTDGEPGALNATVVDGSRVVIRLSSSKHLHREQGATLTVGDKQFAFRRIEPGEQAASPGKSQPDSELWLLDDDASPLAAVSDTIPFEIQVTDVDGLQLASPLQGYVRRKADRAPKATLQVTTRSVLPDARPSILFGAVDDFGLAKLQLDVLRQTAEGKPQLLESIQLPLAARPTRLEPLLFAIPATAAAALDRGELPAEILAGLAKDNFPQELALTVEPIRPGEVWNLVGPHRGWHFAVKRDKQSGVLQVFRQFVLDLSPLALETGQELLLVVRAVDYRGGQSGETAVSEPVALTVAGEAGVLADISEPDTRSLESLNRIIQRQLGIGESP